MYLVKKKNSAIYCLIYRIIAFLIGVTAITLQFITNANVKEEYMVNHSWAYFTFQSNVIITILFLYLIIKTIFNLIKNKSLSIANINPIIHTAATIYILVTVIVFWVGIAPTTGMGYVPLTIFDNLFLHLFTGIVTVTDWVLFLKHGKLKKLDFLYVLIYPFIYLIMIIIIAQVIKIPYYTIKIDNKVIDLFYPYIFLDPQIMKIGGMILSIICLVLFFILLGLLFIFLDKQISKKLSKQS